MLDDEHRAFTKDSFKSIEIPSAPFQTIHVDLLKFHTPSRGNNYIFVIIDSFPKFVITKVIKKKTACTVIKSIYEEFILKFGMCEHLSIISDWNS